LKAEIANTTKKLNDLHTLRLEYNAKSSQGEQSIAHSKAQILRLVETFNAKEADPMGSAEGSVYLQMTLLSNLTLLATKMRELASTPQQEGKKDSFYFDTAESISFQAVCVSRLLKGIY